MEPKEKCSHDCGDWWKEDMLHSISKELEPHCPYCEQPAVRLGSKDIKQFFSEEDEGFITAYGNISAFGATRIESYKEFCVAITGAIEVIEDHHLAEIKAKEEDKEQLKREAMMIHRINKNFKSRMAALEAEIKTRDDEIEKARQIIISDLDKERDAHLTLIQLASKAVNMIYFHSNCVKVRNSEIDELKSKLSSLEAENAALRAGIFCYSCRKEIEFKGGRPFLFCVDCEKAKSAKLVEALKKINKFGGCLCGSRESCDSCNPYSSINQAQKIARDALAEEEQRK